MPASVQFLTAPDLCSRVAYLLPGVSKQVRATKPEVAALSADTLGAKLKRCRLERGIRQIDAARDMGVNEYSVTLWENGREPHVSMYPAIIRFLGHEPWPDPHDTSDHLKAERRRRGWSIKRAARELGVDEGTFAQWERSRSVTRRSARIIAAFLRIAPIVGELHAAR